MALNPCVRTILCTLSNPALQVIENAVNAQITFAQTQIIVYQTQLAALEIQLIPLKAARRVAQQVVSTAIGVTQLIPLEIISDCADLGTFNINVSQLANRKLNDALALIDEFSRAISFQQELQLLVDELQGVVAQFEDLKLTIEECSA